MVKRFKNWVIASMAMTALVSGTGLNAQDNGNGYNANDNCYYDAGCGYEETYCAPNYAMIGAGLLAVAAITIAIIALVDDDDTHIHGHP